MAPPPTVYLPSNRIESNRIEFITDVSARGFVIDFLFSLFVFRFCFVFFFFVFIRRGASRKGTAPVNIKTRRKSYFYKFNLTHPSIKIQLNSLVLKTKYENIYQMLRGQIGLKLVSNIINTQRKCVMKSILKAVGSDSGSDTDTNSDPD